MQVDLINVAKEALKNKTVIVKKIDKNKIKVSYRGTSPMNTPKPLILPKIIDINEELVENIGMYVGDGTLNSIKRHQLEFVTIDIDMAKNYLDFLRNRFYIKIEDMSFIIRYRKGKKEEIKEKWIKALEISKEKIIAKKQTKYKMQDNITILVNSIIFTLMFRKLVEKLLPLIKQNSELRKAFLRGEFASDGKFIVEKDTNTYYISEMTFCYNYKNEQWLREYLIKCLKLESITKINENREGFIRITGWDNYFKLWKIRIFDCCKRKKNKFLSTIKQACIYLILYTDITKSIVDSLNLTKKSIAEKININRSNFFKVLKGKQSLTIEQFNELLKLINKNLDNYYNQIDRIRIGKLNYLPFSRDFMNFIVNEKFRQ